MGALAVFCVNVLISDDLLKEPLSIASDALGCLLGSDLVEKGDPDKLVFTQVC